MVVQFRTLLAEIIVQHLHRPHPLVIRAWLWLGAEADNLEEKRRCLEAVLELYPESQARVRLALLHQGQIRELDTTSIANYGCQF